MCVAGTVFALFVTGCASAENQPLAKDQYLRAVKPVIQVINNREHGLVIRTVGETSALHFTVYVVSPRVIERQANLLRAMTPPKGVNRTHRRFVAALYTYANRFPVLRARLRRATSLQQLKALVCNASREFSGVEQEFARAGYDLPPLRSASRCR